MFNATKYEQNIQQFVGQGEPNFLKSPGHRSHRRVPLCGQVVDATASATAGESGHGYWAWWDIHYIYIYVSPDNNYVNDYMIAYDCL